MTDKILILRNLENESVWAKKLKSKREVGHHISCFIDKFTYVPIVQYVEYERAEYTPSRSYRVALNDVGLKTLCAKDHQVRKHSKTK